MINSCLLCDSKNLTLAVMVPKMPVVDAYTVKPNSLPLHKCDVYRCEDCGHAQLRDTLPPDQIFRSYLFKTGDHLHLLSHFSQYADWLYKSFDTSFVIEVGCNDGTLLDMLPLSTRKLGIDPSNIPCAHPVIREFLNPDVARSLTKEHGHAPVIVANHVFAHTDDMHSMLESIRLMMTSRGAFVFEVAYAKDMLDKCLFDQIEHEHISYHTLAALIPFLNRHGLELTEFSHNDCKGGSIRCVARPIDSGHFPAYSENITLSNYCDFADEIRAKREALENIGHCIGYGASAPCTSVIYQMNLEDRLYMLVDDNPKRQHLYSPGASLPVLPSSTLYHTAEPIVILAPRYADQIMARHPKIKHRFVVP